MPTTDTLLESPRWREEDLGLPLPDSPHAVSVALPLWQHVIDYEEGDPAVRGKLQTGYPRFVIHPQVQRLFELCQARFAKPGETCFAFPSERSALRCAGFVAARTGHTPRLDSLGQFGIHAITLPEEDFDTAKKCWQHYGEIVSSRCAEAVLEGRGAPDSAGHKATLRKRIADFAGGDAGDVYLFPSGMAAVARAVAVAQHLAPGRKSGQLGFPYVDVFKVQAVDGPGAHLFTQGCEADLEALAKLLTDSQLSAVVNETPGNPLLQSTDLPRLAELLRGHGTPLIIDDTTGTFANVDALPHADMVVTSLTKAFSGTGDVMAGSLLLNARGAHYAELKAWLEEVHEDLLWAEDAAVLERNSRDFPERMTQINETAEALCDFLHAHPAVEKLLYPKYIDQAQYDLTKKPGGGYGGLFSMVLKDGAVNAPRFFDALRVSKGPSLGNNFTLACPYVLLAHYGELEWVRSCGVSPNLVRVSVGLEAADDLIARFDAALGALG